MWAPPHPNPGALAGAEGPGGLSLSHPKAFPSSRRPDSARGSTRRSRLARSSGWTSLALGTGCASGCHVPQQALGGRVGGGAAADPEWPGQSSGQIGVGTRGPGVRRSVW